MDKEYFVEVMEEVQRLHEEQEKFNELLKVIDPEFGDGYIHNASILLILEMLMKIFDDYNQNIGYYVWELDFGKNYKDGCITEEDGTPIPLSTPWELYDLITGANIVEEE